MNNMKATPGPWIVTTSNVSLLDHASICVRSLKTNTLVAITGTEAASNKDTVTANAALISIAPDMLDALIAIQESALMDMETGENGIHSRPINELISAVFAKLANEAGV
jgi:hypothetical protein